MEKASKILTLIFLLGLAYIAWSVFVYTPNRELAAKSVDLKMVIAGPSMLPTLHEGDLVHYSETKPDVGDIAIFTCHTDRCNAPSDEIFIKRVSAIDGDCYTVLGDNPEKSTDSRSFGPLCGSEIAFEGVVTSIDLAK